MLLYHIYWLKWTPSFWDGYGTSQNIPANDGTDLSYKAYISREKHSNILVMQMGLLNKLDLISNMMLDGNVFVAETMKTSFEFKKKLYEATWLER